MTSSITAQLKIATAEYHRLAEKSLVNKSLFSPAIDKHTYAHALARYYGIFKPLEERLEHCPICVNLGYESRSNYLEQELLILNWSPTEIRQIPTVGSLPDNTSAASRLGIAYVLEGSRSGGPIIHQQLKKHLSGYPTANAKDYFFTQDSIQQVKTSWQYFKTEIDAWFAAQKTSIHQQAISSACQTFMLFASWLNKPINATETPTKAFQQSINL